MEQNKIVCFQELIRVVHQETSFKISFKPVHLEKLIYWDCSLSYGSSVEKQILEFFTVIYGDQNTINI